ncbi:hypothetical protein AVEN_211064-1, partial [Araneus ventricosus]
CEKVGSKLHYAIECLLTESWHLIRLETQLGNLWFQKVASNQLSRNRIFNTFRFIHTNGLPAFLLQLWRSWFQPPLYHRMRPHRIVASYKTRTAGGRFLVPKGLIQPALQE